MTQPDGDVHAPDDHLGRALRSGADAVLVARIEGRSVVPELANEAARVLFGSGAGDELGTAAQTPSAAARSILQSVRQAATRTRATRETLMLPTGTGARMAVEVQLEPLEPRDGAARVLAVVRASDPALEPVGATTAAQTVGVLRYEHGLGAVFVDDGLLVLLGLAHEHALGQGWLDAVHAADRARVAACVRSRRSGA